MFLFTLFRASASQLLDLPDVAREEEPGVSKPAPSTSGAGPPGLRGGQGVPSRSMCCQPPLVLPLQNGLGEAQWSQKLLCKRLPRSCSTGKQGSRFVSKKLEETNSKTTTGEHRHPHIIDLCTHQVTCSHDGQGRLAPQFITILRGTGASAKSRGSSGTQFSPGEKEMILISCKALHGRAG